MRSGSDTIWHCMEKQIFWPWSESQQLTAVYRSWSRHLEELETVGNISAHRRTSRVKWKLRQGQGCQTPFSVWATWSSIQSQVCQKSRTTYPSLPKTLSKRRYFFLFCLINCIKSLNPQGASYYKVTREPPKTLQRSFSRLHVRHHVWSLGVWNSMRRLALLQMTSCPIYKIVLFHPHRKVFQHEQSL